MLVSIQTTDHRPDPAQLFYNSKFLVTFATLNTKNIIGLRLALWVKFLKSDFDV